MQGSARHRWLRIMFLACGALLILLSSLPASGTSAATKGKKPRPRSHAGSKTAHGETPVLRPHRVGDIFGVGSFITQRSAGTAGLVVGRANLLDAHWVREEFTATRLHASARGKYWWGYFDPVVKRERHAGLHVLGLLDYSNTWGYGDHGTVPHAGISRVVSDFALYAYRVARHYRGRIHDWQVWNEPNLVQFWHPAPSVTDYGLLLRAAYRAIKKADPHNRVVMAGTSGVDLPFVRYLVAHHVPFDALSVHPYRDRPETSLLRQIVELRKLHKPIWFTEIGWPAGPCYSCTDETAQAAYLVRFYALAAAAGVQRVFWYDLRDDAHTDGNPEAHFGLLRRDLSAKPSFVAYARLARLMHHARFLGSDAFDRDGLYVLRFSGIDGPFTIAWNTGDSARAILLPWSHSSGTVRTADGSWSASLLPSSGRVSVTIPPGGQPQVLSVHEPRFHPSTLGPLLHFAPPPPAPPPGAPASHPTSTPGGAWVVNPTPTAAPTRTPRPTEHGVATPKPTKRHTPAPIPTSTPSPTPTLGL